METGEFVKIKEKFKNADVNGKIDIYINTEGLTVEQYTSLLHDFPIEAINELDKRLG